MLSFQIPSLPWLSVTPRIGGRYTTWSKSTAEVFLDPSNPLGAFETVVLDESVERAYAVQGGRELRVYVTEGKLSDLEIAELSGEIAGRISDEMTFPGQIKVTVIRALEAVAVAH